MDCFNRILQYARSNRHVRESIDVVEKAFSSYSLGETCVSFNGGKDCTAVLHLVHSVATNSGLIKPDGKQIIAFYTQLPNHFAEESKFVMDMVQRYNLSLMKYSSDSIKRSLVDLKKDLPHLEAVFIGSRHDDLPQLRMDFFAPTDESWPRLMRVNPILNWTYEQVWDFIRQLEIPYCDLYNQGYSSLGTKDNTYKNSRLLKINADGTSYYLPAWNLTKSSEERVSRFQDA